jgi:hypothetical protein
MEKRSITPPEAVSLVIAILVGCVTPIGLYSSWPRPPSSGYRADAMQGLFVIVELAPTLIVLMVVEFFLLLAVENLFYQAFMSGLLITSHFVKALVIAMAIAIPLAIVGWLAQALYVGRNLLDLRNPSIKDLAIISTIIVGVVPLVGSIVLAIFIPARQVYRQFRPGQDTTIVDDGKPVN